LTTVMLFIIYHPIKNMVHIIFSLNYQMKSIESTQYEAARAVSGAWKGTSTVKLYEELGWKSLSDRRKSRRFIPFYKIFNDYAPSYLKYLIPESVTFLFGKRRENVLHNFKYRTQTFANRFFPMT
jgi:hypothetical protein